MTTLIHRQFVIIVFLGVFVSGLDGSPDNITMDLRNDGASKIVQALKNQTYTINVVNIPANISIIICQAHSHIENLTMSYTPEAAIHNSISGKNIGLAFRLQNTETKKQIWLFNFGLKDIKVLIVVSSLDFYGPVPGGCNMEFPVKIAPYLKLKSDTIQVNLEHQHANFGAQRDQPFAKCSYSSLYMSYDIYISFLKENDFGEEEYFRKVHSMSDISFIKDHSSKAVAYSLHPDTRYSFLMYPNLGVVYNVIAKYTVNNEVKEAAYIPIVSYGCSPSEFSEYGCRIKYSVVGKSFLFLLSIFGFIVAFFGHSLLGPVIFFFGILASFLFGFIFLGRYLALSKEKTADMSIIVGLVGGLLFLFLWLWFHHHIILLLLNGFTFGFLATATVFYTPIGNFELFINEKNFWTLLSTGILFIMVLTLIIPKWMTILSSSVVGNYVLLIFYDDFVGTRLSYIILNIIKRAVSKKLGFAANDLPFQANDIIMSTVWVILSLISVISWWKKLFFKRFYGNSYSNPYFSVLSTAENNSSNIGQESENEHIYQPLVKENNIVSYRTF